MLILEICFLVERWSREAQLSAVWGLPTAMFSVLPMMPEEMTHDGWLHPPTPGWRNSVAFLRAMLFVIARWPGCPSYLRGMATSDEEWSEEEFGTLQYAATNFYTDNFVRMFHRLPVVPVPFSEMSTT